MITDIIFDWGSVMCPDNNQYAAKILSKRYALNEDEFYFKIASEEVRYFKQRDDRAYFEKISDLFSIPAGELRKVLNEVKPYEEMFTLVKKISKKFRMHLLSNQMQSRTDHIKTSYDLSFFKHVFFSSEMGMMKPEKEIYLFVLNEIKQEAENCIFIDDNIKYIDAARELGINALLFKNIQQIRTDLAAHIG